MKEIDINQYFSIGQPIVTPDLNNKENCSDRSKFSTMEDSKISQRESPKCVIKHEEFLIEVEYFVDCLWIVQSVHEVHRTIK